MRIVYASGFLRAYEKLSEEIKDATEERESIFRENPFDPALRTHKLHGRLSGFWSFSVDFRYRVVFEFADRDMVYFHLIGNHDVYQ